MTHLPRVDEFLPSEAELDAQRRGLVREFAATAPEWSRRATRRRFVRGGVVVAAVAAVAALGISVVPGPGGTSLTPIASAEAAVAVDRGEILHVVVRYSHGPYESMAQVTDGPGGRVVGIETGDSESWVALSPLRRRIVRFLDSPDGGPQPTVETVYADGVLQVRNSWEPSPLITRFSDQERASQERELTQPPGLGDLDGSVDPVATVRSLLHSGRLHDRGVTRTADNRSVRRLVGVEPGYTDAGGTWTPPVRFDYLVDSETSAPIEVRSTQVLAARPDDPEPAARRERRIVQRWSFERFERIPLDQQTQQLLRPAR